MDTPSACIYAKIYYVYHKRRTLLPRYKNNILFFKKFIDDKLVSGYHLTTQTTGKTSNKTHRLVFWNGKRKNAR